jgi:hypothetical protein
VEWLVIEWPSEAPEPTKYWLSTVPEEVDLAELVALAKIRWRIERDYQELKDGLGLDHYEGRGWRGIRARKYKRPLEPRLKVGRCFPGCEGRARSGPDRDDGAVGCEAGSGGPR